MKKHNPKQRLLSNEQIKEAYDIYINTDATVQDLADEYDMNVRTMRKYFYMARDGQLDTVSYNTVNIEPSYDERITQARQLHDEGQSIRSIAIQLDFSYTTLYRRLTNA